LTSGGINVIIKQSPRLPIVERTHTERLRLVKGAGAKKQGKLERPNVFAFYDYREFMKVWFEYLRQTKPGFSFKQIALETQIAVSYLPMVMSGKRELSLKIWMKIQPLLFLSQSEANYLENLVRLKNSDSQEARLLVFDQMKRSHGFQRKNPEDVELLEYMSRWYYIAIREMAALPDFELSPRRIQETLNFRVSLKEISVAVDFLFRAGYLQLAEGGTIAPPKENLRCSGEAFRAALTKYHREMFSLAARSIDVTPSDDRNLLGYSFPIHKSQFQKAKEILDKALVEIKNLESKNEAPPNMVYHVEFALFPLTKNSTEAKQ
jgi:uncharacterized protein (TIGR02147 family)